MISSSLGTIVYWPFDETGRCEMKEVRSVPTWRAEADAERTEWA